MTVALILGFCFFVVTSGYLFFRTLRVYRAWHDENMEQAERKRLTRRMAEAVGVWQISVGVVILCGPGPVTAASAITVIGAGCIILFGSWLSGRVEGVL